MILSQSLAIFTPAIHNYKTVDTELIKMYFSFSIKSSVLNTSKV